MKKGDRSIEFHLGFFGTGHGKVHRAQVVTGMLVWLSCKNAHAVPKQNDHYAEGGPDSGSAFHYSVL
jgi:hypothetical protein